MAVRRKESKKKKDVAKRSKSNGTANGHVVHSNGFIPSTPTKSAMQLKLQKLHYLPVAAALSGCLAIGVSYLIACFLGDVVHHPPYVSDSGGDPPQSAIFGFFLVLGSGIGLVCFFLINLFITECNKNNNPFVRRIVVLFNVAIIVGAASLVFVAVNPVAHLRRDGTWVLPVFLPHMIGATGFFVCGSTVMCLYTFITYLNCPKYFSYAVFYQRLATALLGTFAMVLTAVTLPLSELSKREYSADSGTKHIPGAFLSILGEWTMVICYEVFFLTFIQDFKRMRVTVNFEYGEESNETTPDVKSMRLS